MSTAHDAGRADRREALARFLLDSRALTPDWLPAWRSAPRHAFLPDLIWPYDMATRTSTPVDRRTDPAGWEFAAHADVPLTTQWDDGTHPGPAPGRVATSSASMPSVVARMLADLHLRPGARVLEIGTGTGWNAALLSARLGDRNVVTVEIDPAIAADARAALDRAGFAPRVICGDGADGWPDAAPHDHVIATAGVRHLPPAWLAQTRPGGTVLAPWGTHYCAEDALLRLTVAPDGSASGPFLRPLEFMKLRAQRLDWQRFSGHVTDHPGDATRSATSVTLAELTGQRQFRGPEFTLGLCVPDCAHVLNPAPAGTTAWFFDLTPGSRAWASVAFPADGTAATVHQSGERRLWDEVARALAWWRGQVAPGVDAFGLAVAPDGTARPWLGDPSRPLPSFAP